MTIFSPLVCPPTATCQSRNFTKDKRLLTSDAFKRVFNQPDKKIHTSHLLLLVKKRSTLEVVDIDCTSQPSRLGLAITKKKLKTAVARNRLKRLARENFRQSAIHHSKNAVDVVLIVKIPYAKDFAIETQVQEIFTKLTHYLQ